MRRFRQIIAARGDWSRLVLLIAAGVSIALVATADEADEPKRLDPAAWGSDHVGKPLPAYVTGDECLFCHRDTGANWGENRHQLTIQPSTPDDPALGRLRKLPQGSDLADATTHLMGDERMTRFLKRSTEYGRLEMLSTAFIPHHAIDESDTNQADKKNGKLIHSAAAHWDSKIFADRCAGCHTTAVDMPARAFAALSLDCYACHGDVDLGHTKDTNLVLLSKKNRQPRDVISICGQCHLRGGKSQSTALPYPHKFVAGDNLFRDFQVDFSDKLVQSLPVADQHIYQNARDVVVLGNSSVDCLTCHDVHRQSSDKHRDLTASALCSSCHVVGKSSFRLREEMLSTSRLRAHSRICDY